MKICSKCGINKELEEFGIDKKAKDGHRADCKECIKRQRQGLPPLKSKEEVRKIKEASRKLQEVTKPSKSTAISTIKKCSICKEYKHIDLFSNDKKTKDGKYPQCKECVKEQRANRSKEEKERVKAWYKEYNKQYRENNREKEKERLKEYYNNNKESYFKRNKERQAQIKANGGKHGAIDWAKCLAYFDFCDAYTGEQLTNSNISKEHLIPVKAGGKSSIDNIVPVTRGTNKSKSDALNWGEWYREQSFYSKEREAKINRWVELNQSKEIKRVNND